MNSSFEPIDKDTMKSNMIRMSLVATVLGGFWLSVSGVQAASVVFTGGSMDLTFYYESAAQRWDVVLRNKGTTQATGNTSVYGGFTGIVGYDGVNDVTFNSLQLIVTTPKLVSHGTLNYWMAPANGSPFFDGSPGNPDFGIRTRLREDLGSGQVQQFDNMNLVLDWDASTKPLGAEFLMTFWDVSDPNNVIAVPMIDTANNDFSGTFGNYTHVHRNFGFSEAGDYSLVFRAQGVGGAHGDTAPMSESFTINFTVVPEPSTAMLGALAMAAFGLRRKRK